MRRVQDIVEVKFGVICIIMFSYSRPVVLAPIVMGSIECRAGIVMNIQGVSFLVGSC